MSRRTTPFRCTIGFDPEGISMVQNPTRLLCRRSDRYLIRGSIFSLLIDVCGKRDRDIWGCEPAGLGDITRACQVRVFIFSGRGLFRDFCGLSFRKSGGPLQLGPPVPFFTSGHGRHSFRPPWPFALHQAHLACRDFYSALSFHLGEITAEGLSDDIPEGLIGLLRVGSRTPHDINRGVYEDAADTGCGRGAGLCRRRRCGCGLRTTGNFTPRCRLCSRICEDQPFLADFAQPIDVVLANCYVHATDVSCRSPGTNNLRLGQRRQAAESRQQMSNQHRHRSLL